MKILFHTVHDEMTAEYMEKHPHVSEAEAVCKTADAAMEATVDRYADMCDHAADEAKERML